MVSNVINREIIKGHLPSHKASKETEDTACLVEASSSRRMTISFGKVCSCDGEESQVDEEKDEDVDNMRWYGGDQKSKHKDGPH